MPLAGFEPAVPASERPQTDALDGAATGIGMCALTTKLKFYKVRSQFPKLYDDNTEKYIRAYSITSKYVRL
jgi:hypothetical protein